MLLTIMKITIKNNNTNNTNNNSNSNNKPCVKRLTQLALVCNHQLHSRCMNIGNQVIELDMSKCLHSHHVTFGLARYFVNIIAVATAGG